jgi:hypothetical protein
LPPIRTFWRSLDVDWSSVPSRKDSGCSLEDCEACGLAEPLPRLEPDTRDMLGLAGMTLIGHAMRLSLA